uniref:Uncharacterized protein n=1 Tax=Rhizophora mucronata TaxID=61149 RepID=A0A2P2PD73_RHIMU
MHCLPGYACLLFVQEFMHGKFLNIYVRLPVVSVDLL